ncbi:MAG: ATP-binding protein [Dehalococcoidales bacterium]|nr:ATP-binding protein [Dehalococcoidales bacterium]
MKIRHLLIERFRGIKTLDWYPNSDLVCLIGSGDSRKSTILDAIDLALNPRSGISFDDSDFYQLKTDEPILITVSVTDFPSDLLRENKFGLFLSGYCNGECHDDFLTGDDPMLTIRLTVDKSLDPEWLIINKEHPEGHYVSGRDREKLGVMRLGGYVNQQLTWRRGTALSRLTGEPDDIDMILAEASRSARQKIPAGSLVHFQEAAKKAEVLGRALGVLPQSEYVPNLDAAAVNIGEAGFTLHDGEVPIRRVGLGARRLLIMAVQSHLAESGSIILIDEFEHGLEPHRVRHLLRRFEKQAGENTFGQVILTSHSSIVVEEVPGRLNVVKPGATVEIIPVPCDLVATVRKASEAFLGNHVLVCEGKTEVGLCRAFDEYLLGQGKDSFACRGVVPAEGGGSVAVKVSEDLIGLGYKVLYLGDSDTKDIHIKKDEMEKMGIVVLIWNDKLAIEERIFNDIPWMGVLETLKIASDDRGEDSIRDSVASKLGRKPTELGNISTWKESDELRLAIGFSAKKLNWFKRIDTGEEFGKVAIKYLSGMATKDIEEKLNLIRAWSEQ